MITDPDTNTPAAPPTAEQAKVAAKWAIEPGINAAMVIEKYGGRPLGAYHMVDTYEAIDDATRSIQSGDLKQAEAMLFAQATALESIFVNLARRATKQDFMAHWEAYLRMALKAQNQCRQTLETLGTLKNPPLVIARQANINNGGQQQINNGATPPVPNAHAGKQETAPIELLEVCNGERLDTGAAGAASGADPQMETVGAIHRATDR